jgi:ferredoxin-NADP reductase
MNKYTLKSVSQLTETCYELNLKPNSQTDIIEFRAGQYVALSIQGKVKKSTVRCFSIASSSLRSDGSLDIGIRLGGKYTKLIKSSVPGAEVSVEGPFGEFTPQLDSPRRLVLIAGGIGVTPIVSIIKTIAESKSSRQTTLLYFNNRAEDIPYLNDIESMSNQSWLKTYVITRSGSAALPNVKIGELDRAQMSKVIDTQNNTDYYICGPSGFMKKAVQILLEGSIPTQYIHTESFGSSQSKKSSKFSASLITYMVTAAMIVLSVGAIATKDFVQKELNKLESSQDSDDSSSEPSESNISPQNKPSTGTYQSPRSTVS